MLVCFIQMCMTMENNDKKKRQREENKRKLHDFIKTKTNNELL